MPEWAIEADPGKCTPSFPTFDTLALALGAASVPAFKRVGLKAPRILVRFLPDGAWEPVPWTDIPDDEWASWAEAETCSCGLDEPKGFPRKPVKGDRCPVGGLQLHHWHGDVCVCCGGTR